MITTDIKILKKISKNYDGTEQARSRLIKSLELNLFECEKNGVGLSAIQIGIPLRVAIIRTKKLSMDLYNATILNGSEMITYKGEGCLSIPNKFVTTRRMNKVTILNGDGRRHVLTGFEAVVAQHEIDHFEGILILDREIQKEV